MLAMVARRVGFGLLPISLASIITATLMVLTGCLSMNEAYGAIQWRAVFLIAGMLPLGTAMQATGTAQYLADFVSNWTQHYGITVQLAGLFLLTSLASQVMPNPVVVVLMAPVALNMAANQGLSPYALMMLLAVSASAQHHHTHRPPLQRAGDGAGRLQVHRLPQGGCAAGGHRHAGHAAGPCRSSGRCINRTIPAPKNASLHALNLTERFHRLT